MRRTMVISLFLVVILAAAVLGLTSRERCQITQIFDTYVSQLILSPSRDKYLILYGNDVTIFDAKTDEVLIKESIKTNEREITDFEWLNDDELVVVVMDYKNDLHGEFVTKDLSQFKQLDLFREDSSVYFAPSYRRKLYQSNSDKKLLIQYENGETWDTGIAFDFTGFHWSNDDRYLQVSADKEEYLIDTVAKTTRKKYLMSSDWAPTKNILWLMGFCFYDPETQEVTYLNRGGIPEHPVKLFTWSPDSEKILINTGKELFLSHINTPEVSPKKLLKVDEPSYLEDDVFWSKDGRSLFGIYQRTARNIAKPMDFFAFKIDLVTGKIKKVYINAYLHREIHWLDEQTILYEDRLREGIFKAKIRWD